MKWKLPPKIKIHEALGSIADKRVWIEGDEADVESSSRGKKYHVSYEPGTNSVTANDNGSYWQGYLGYPAIAFLMVRGVIRYDPKYAQALKDIHWKDINQKFKNDFDKTDKYVLELVGKRGVDLTEFNAEIDRIYEQIKKLSLKKLGTTDVPPQGY